MSYDTSIVIWTGRALAEVDRVGNYTSNVHRIYREVLSVPQPGGGRYGGEGPADPRPGLPGLSGIGCEAAASLLAGAIEAMRAREDELRQLEPESGWGSYRGALGYLERIMIACREHPLATLRVTW